MVSIFLAVIFFGVHVGAATRQKPAKHSGPKKVHAIALLLNGEQLALNPSPIVYKGRLLVPVRRIIEALGLDFQRSGKSITTHVGYKTVTLQIDSQRADVNGNPVDLDSPPVEIKYVLYAPLRFFTDILGAQASFDRRANAVSIVAQLIGVTGNGIMTHGNRVQEVGTVTAIDLNSDPPTITLTYNASVRTVPIVANAEISLQDVNANATVPGELSDVHPGDFVHLAGNRDGGMDNVLDQFGSRVGTVEAVAAGQMVLDSGDIIVPSRATTVTINGSQAAFTDVHPGDQVIIRYNINSGEVREILVGNGPPGTQTAMKAAPPKTPPGVSDFAPDNGEVVNNDAPVIYATFVSDGEPVNPSSEIIWVNGHDETASSVRTASFIRYTPGVSYPDGEMHITVRVSDSAGNTTTRSWYFQIKTR